MTERGRCDHCGSRLPSWTPPQIVAAFKRWADREGRQPVAREWNRGTPEHPSFGTVERIFGSWNAGLVAAGFLARGSNGARLWTREQAEQVLFEWVFKHGRVPAYDEWRLVAADESRPTTQQVRTLYLSWNAFLVAAGYDPAVKYRTVDGYRRQAGAALRTRNDAGRLVAA